MELTTEDGKVISNPSNTELHEALDRAGMSEDGYAILTASSRYYIQVAGNKKIGYIAEYREGDESTHHSSTVSDLSHQQVVDLLTAYLNGSSWKTLVTWQAGISNEQRHVNKILILFFAVGMLLVVSGAYWTYATHQFLNRAVEVEGTIVKLFKGRDGYTPVVKYTDRQGHTHTLRSSVTTNNPSFFVGEQVTVAYEPGFPQNAMIVNYGETWGLKLFMLVFGGVCCIGTIAFWLKFVRR